MIRLTRLAIVALSFTLLMPRPALAWGEYGHRTVASIAWANMTPAARAQVAQLIRAAPRLNTPACRLNSIGDASYWPDCIRGYGDRFKHTYPWHYQNIAICRPFDANAKCPDGNCAPRQIERHLQRLKDRKLPPHERLFSFAFVVHLMGDMHQPLHSGDNGDRGGNDVKASYGRKTSDRLNLHWIWDDSLAERAMSEPPGGPRGLMSEIKPADRVAYTKGGIDDWLREAWQASRDIAYGKLPGVDICNAAPSGEVKLGEPYVADSRGIIRLQTKRAGLRLARLLNAALSPAD